MEPLDDAMVNGNMSRSGLRLDSLQNQRMQSCQHTYHHQGAAYMGKQSRTVALGRHQPTLTEESPGVWATLLQYKRTHRREPNPGHYNMLAMFLVSR